MAPATRGKLSSKRKTPSTPQSSKGGITTIPRKKGLSKSWKSLVDWRSKAKKEKKEGNVDNLRKCEECDFEIKGKGDEGKGDEGKGSNGKGEEGMVDEGKGDEGKVNKGKGDEGMDDEGKRDEGKGDKGQEDEGKGDKGKEENADGLNGAKAKEFSIRSSAREKMQKSIGSCAAGLVAVAIATDSSLGGMQPYGTSYELSRDGSGDVANLGDVDDGDLIPCKVVYGSSSTDLY